MDLAQMEAIAVDLDKRVTALERQKLPATFAPQNDFFINSGTQVTQQTIEVTEIKLEEGRIYSEGGLVYYENAAGEKQPLDLAAGHLETETVEGKEELFYVNKKKEKTKLGGGGGGKIGKGKWAGELVNVKKSETKEGFIPANAEHDRLIMLSPHLKNEEAAGEVNVKFSFAPEYEGAKAGTELFVALPPATITQRQDIATLLVPKAVAVTASFTVNLATKEKAFVIIDGYIEVPLD